MYILWISTQKSRIRTMTKKTPIMFLLHFLSANEKIDEAILKDNLLVNFLASSCGLMRSSGGQSTNSWLLDPSRR